MLEDHDVLFERVDHLAQEADAYAAGAVLAANYIVVLEDVAEAEGVLLALRGVLFEEPFWQRKGVFRRLNHYAKV